MISPRVAYVADGVDQRRHQVDLGVGGLPSAASGQRGVDGGLVAVVADLARAA